VVKNLGDFFSFFAVEIIKEFVNSDLSEIKEKISEINGFEYYVYKRKNKVYKRVYVSKEIHDKWEKIPKEYRKYLQFLIHKKFMEVIKTWQQKLKSEMEMVEKAETFSTKL
jgi:gas vesicle protein